MVLKSKSSREYNHALTLQINIIPPSSPHQLRRHKEINETEELESVKI